MDNCLIGMTENPESQHEQEASDYTPISEEELSRTFFSAEDMASKIRTRMADRGETIESLAAKSKLGKRFIWDILQGQDRPETEYLMRVFDALEFTPRRLRGFAFGPWAEKLADAMGDEIPEEFVYIDPDPDGFKGNEQSKTFFDTFEGAAPWMNL